MLLLHCITVKNIFWGKELKHGKAELETTVPSSPGGYWNTEFMGVIEKDQGNQKHFCTQWNDHRAGDQQPKTKIICEHQGLSWTSIHFLQHLMEKCLITGYCSSFSKLGVLEKFEHRLLKQEESLPSVVVGSDKGLKETQP